MFLLLKKVINWSQLFQNSTGTSKSRSQKWLTFSVEFSTIQHFKGLENTQNFFR